MGSTLEHGIYLPSEGEKNCYQGLASNWNKVDGALGDVAGLKQLIESKFTKEIVTELPTEDINPYCIYMILKTDPETNNIYDEWVYINNAWEYLGNTQVDMTQYYTKTEVNELPAVASGVTSTKVGNYDTHIADTNIHVTANDKTKWNTVALIKQLRLVNTQVGSATTIAFANIDDTNGIKVGDKCMDLDGKMFEITAVDTANSTVTVGSALIDLALDGNVVHKSGNETISGTKTITDANLEFKSTSAEYGVSVGDSNVIFKDKNNLQTFRIWNRVFYAGVDNNLVSFFITQKVDNTYYTFNGIQLYTNTGNKTAILRPILANNNADGLSVSLGSSDRRWKDVYALNYYYGSSNVEFSDKFITTDTAQTITGDKIFKNFNIYNSDTTAYASYLNLKNQRNVRGSTTDTGVQGIQFQDKNSKSLTMLESRVISNGNTGFNIICYNIDGNNQNVSDGVSVIKTPSATNFAPTTDNAVTCGRSLAKWSDVQTYQINGLTPSSLGMPADSYIDISSYVTDLTGGNNQYTAPANGWIYVDSNTTISSVIINNTRGYSTGFIFTGQLGRQRNTLPVCKDDQILINVNCTGLNAVRFIPCQGNV